MTIHKVRLWAVTGLAVVMLGAGAGAAFATDPAGTGVEATEPTTDSTGVEATESTTDSTGVEATESTADSTGVEATESTADPAGVEATESTADPAEAGAVETGHADAPGVDVNWEFNGEE